jgi:hypothetical protein
MKRRCGLEEIEVKYEIYNHAVFVVMGPWERLKDYMQWRYGEVPLDMMRSEAGCKAMFSHKPGMAPVIWLPRRPRDPNTIASLGHELVHLLRAVLVDHIGMPLADPSDEAFAHLFGHTMKVVLEQTWSRKKS